jgi:hypothetical protein
MEQLQCRNYHQGQCRVFEGNRTLDATCSPQTLRDLRLFYLAPLRRAFESFHIPEEYQRNPNKHHLMISMFPNPSKDSGRTTEIHTEYGTTFYHVFVNLDLSTRHRERFLNSQCPILAEFNPEGPSKLVESRKPHAAEHKQDITS